jgi:hypothetical protein
MIVSNSKLNILTYEALNKKKGDLSPFFLFKYLMIQKSSF